MPTITEGTWKGAKTLVLTSGALRATLLPEHGARIASLIHTPTNREILWWPDDLTTLPEPTYGMPYADHPAVGIDECIPTIGVDQIGGEELPDHGEAWSQPWETRVVGEWVETLVTLRTMPFHFTRRLSFAADTALRLDYTLTNYSMAPAPALWAMHPLMRWHAGMRVVLPPAVTAVEVGSVSGSSPLVAGASSVPWPAASGLDLAGAQLNTDDTPAATKLYTGPLAEGWAALHDPAARFAVGFAFPVETTPFLGLWLNRGAWGGYTHVALEPTTGPAETPTTAAARGQILIAPANTTVAWSVMLAVGTNVETISGITPEGAFRP